ncbi:YgjP-like metallopeptidase domain-containing protein [Solibacillus sp. FSL K6-1523]|uniref:YgjP-like metallopeptidase domain-containing protein n=1 Tax=Solibacillus sp. FSL K6-1523 TaxID=2921471 RepID=UPI0030F643B9
MKVEFENETIDFIVQYGNRKKLSIHIDSFGFITVKAPNNTSEEVIISAIESNGTLILERIHEMELARENPKARGFYEGGKFLHLGKEYFLHELIDIGELDEETLKKKSQKVLY